MVCDIMKVVCSRCLEVACNLIQNIAVGHSIRIIKTRGVDECKEAAIGFGCGPVMDTDVTCLGRDSMSDYDFLITSNVLDELYVE